MFRNNSVQPLPNHTSGLLGVVRKIPISEPTSRATTSASSATESVQPQAESIQSR